MGDVTALWVAIGGCCGGLLRASLAEAAALCRVSRLWATLIANTAACVLLGWVVAAAQAGSIPPVVAVAAGTGVAGALSTWSTLAGELRDLLGQPDQPLSRRILLAAGYGGLTISTGAAAILLGSLMA